MKRLALVLLGLALAGGLVALGWRLGRGHRVLQDGNAMSLLEMRLAHGSSSIFMLSDLDAGRTNYIRGALQMDVYAGVVVADGLYPYADRDTQERCRDFFVELAQRRADKSPSFAGNMGLGDAAETNLVYILRKYTDKQGDKEGGDK